MQAPEAAPGRPPAAAALRAPPPSAGRLPALRPRCASPRRLPRSRRRPRGACECLRPPSPSACTKGPSCRIGAARSQRPRRDPPPGLRHARHGPPRRAPPRGPPTRSRKAPRSRPRGGPCAWRLVRFSESAAPAALFSLRAQESARARPGRGFTVGRGPIVFAEAVCHAGKGPTRLDNELALSSVHGRLFACHLHSQGEARLWGVHRRRGQLESARGLQSVQRRPPRHHSQGLPRVRGRPGCAGPRSPLASLDCPDSAAGSAGGGPRRP